MPVFECDFAHSILGVQGRLTHRTTKPGQAPGLWFKQVWISEARKLPSWGDGAKLQVSISYDDDCGNGHNSCSITGDIFKGFTNAAGRGVREDLGGGQVTDEIAQAFPELVPLLKWHLVDGDRGPMHYVANATYHASDRDYRGLLAGEQKPLLGLDGVPNWELVASVASPGSVDQYHREKGPVDLGYVPLYAIRKAHKGLTPPADVPALRWQQQMITGEGKARDLEAARRAAVWPEATDAQLCLPKAELAALLEARLPALLEAFRAAMVDACGFWWSPEGRQEVR